MGKVKRLWEELVELEEQDPEFFEDVYDFFMRTSRKELECECGKEKFDFIRHSDWCPKSEEE